MYHPAKSTEQLVLHTSFIRSFIRSFVRVYCKFNLKLLQDRVLKHDHVFKTLDFTRFSRTDRTPLVLCRTLAVGDLYFDVDDCSAGLYAKNTDN